MMGTMDRAELADFLRTRRARLKPLDVGLPEGLRRRTPGLRREEVSQLAGISADYYIRLEQARGPRPSRQVLNALARGLMLTGDERDHLFHLAGEPPLPAGGPSQEVSEGTMNLLMGLENIAAYVLDAKYDILAWNPLASTLLCNLDRQTPEERNVIRWIFQLPDPRQTVCNEDREAFARASVMDLRVAAGRYPRDKGIRDLVAEMMAFSPDFAELWASHDVEVRRNHRKRIEHRLVGIIEVDSQMLHIPDYDQRLVIYAPVPGTGSHEALRELSALTARR
jgi:transcriptional regulator with XRE-family HTH domain